MISNLAYPARVKKGKDGFYLVTFRDVKEAGTDDRDLKKALLAASDALSAALAGYIKDERELPLSSSPRKGEILIHVDATLSAKVALRQLLEDRNMTNADLCRLLKADKTEVRRLLDPDHPSKLDRLDRALRALGSRVIVDIRSIDPREDGPMAT